MNDSLYWQKETAIAAMIVAHPDDETLWGGGAILNRARWSWTIVTLCRRSDADRAPKFFRALAELGATGAMEDMDDGPDQAPLASEVVDRAVLSVLTRRDFDVIVTHSPFGEYTRHLRHEETSESVTALWESGELRARELWLFAYEDSAKKHLPRAISRAPLACELAPEVWQTKRMLIEKLYGFAPNSWEARTTPRTEAFWCFSRPTEYRRWRTAEEKSR